MNFTPGPWNLGSSKVVVWAKGGSTVADAWESSDRSIEECEANARLIAAAPEMYEALKEARYLLIKRGLQESSIFGLVNAAIAKVDGRAQ